MPYSQCQGTVPRAHLLPIGYPCSSGNSIITAALTRDGQALACMVFYARASTPQYLDLKVEAFQKAVEECFGSEPRVQDPNSAGRIQLDRLAACVFYDWKEKVGTSIPLRGLAAVPSYSSGLTTAPLVNNDFGLYATAGCIVMEHASVLLRQIRLFGQDIQVQVSVYFFSVLPMYSRS